MENNQKPKSILDILEELKNNHDKEKKLLEELKDIFKNPKS